jgi:hypothetical protein
MLAFDNSELVNIVYLILAIGLGWIILRFILKLARKIFMIGCVYAFDRESPVVVPQKRPGPRF